MFLAPILVRVGEYVHKLLNPAVLHFTPPLGMSCPRLSRHGRETRVSSFCPSLCFSLLMDDSEQIFIVAGGAFPGLAMAA